jgi:hypothetical protein
VDHTSVSAYASKAFLTNFGAFICSWFSRETAALSCRVENFVLPICGSASRVQQIEMVLIIRSLTWSWVHYSSSVLSCPSLTDHDFSSRNLPPFTSSTASDLSSPQSEDGMSASSVSRMFCNVIHPYLKPYMLRLKLFVILVWIFVCLGMSVIYRCCPTSRVSAVRFMLLCLLKIYINFRYHKCTNPLKTKGRMFYLKTHFVPRCKHFSSRL